MVSRTAVIGACAALCLLVAASPAHADEENHEDYDFYQNVEYHGHEHIDEQHVTVLSYQNFTDFVESHEHTMVEFYAPWCHHCKNLKPEYAGAATEIAKGWGYEFDIAFAKVDTEAEHDLANKFQVDGIPTMLFFSDKGKKRLEYSSEHSIESIVSWVKRRTGPAAALINNATDFEEFVARDESVTFAYMNALEKYDWHAYENLAKHDESHIFGVTTNHELAIDLGIHTSPGMMVFKNFDGGNVLFDGEWDEPSLADFVELESMRLVTPFSSDREAKTHAGKAFKKAKQSSIEWHILMFGDRRNVHQTSPLHKTFQGVAKEYRGKIVFFTIDTDDEGAGMTMDYFGVKASKKARVFMLNKVKGVKYEFDGTITSENLNKFITTTLEGKGVEYKKSEPLPDIPVDADVDVVVGKNYEDIVMDHTKDVFLEVYAHWCGFCQKFAPTYSKLAKRFKKVSSVSIAKMDGSLNEIQGLEYKSFPTMYLFKSNDKGKPILYEGERDVKAMTQFIMEHAAIPFQLKRRKADHEEL